MVSEASNRSPMVGDRLRQLAAGMGGETGAVDQEDERRGGAIEDRNLGAIQLDDRVIHAAAGQGGHDMLDGADAALRRLRQAEGGAEPGIDHVVVARRDVEIDIGTAETDAGAGGGRMQGEAGALAAVQPDTDAADGGLQRPAATCLKREVTVHVHPCLPDARSSVEARKPHPGNPGAPYRRLPGS
jgi:hypothetical protein